MDSKMQQITISITIGDGAGADAPVSVRSIQQVFPAGLRKDPTELGDFFERLAAILLLCTRSPLFLTITGQMKGNLEELLSEFSYDVKSSIETIAASPAAVNNLKKAVGEIHNVIFSQYGTEICPPAKEASEVLQALKKMDEGKGGGS